MMRKFKFKDSISDIKESFRFLIDEYGYRIIEESETNYGTMYLYASSNMEIRLSLYYDYKGNSFYFDLIFGKETVYPNDDDYNNIIPLYRIVQKYEEGFDVKRLQPNENQYIDSLKLNAELLKKYGKQVLLETAEHR